MLASDGQGSFSSSIEMNGMVVAQEGIVLSTIVILRQMRKLLRRYFYILGIIFLVLFGWVWSQAFQASGDSSEKAYGGRIPYRVHQALERMSGDVKNSRRIMSALPDRICFIDGDESVTEYSYAYGTLWRDDFPVVSGVRSFHFWTKI